VDAGWQQSGFLLLLGLVTLISIDTGKVVVSTEIQSKESCLQSQY
jgi:hypothetical protein